jgi:hypothetical protein
MSDKQTDLSAPFPLKFPEYSLFLKSTNLLNISGIIDWIHTMIREFIARLKTRTKEIAEILIGKMGSAICKYSPSFPPAAGKRAQLFTDHLIDDINSTGNSGGAR